MPARHLDEVLELYATFGTERYDEEVTQLDHALQTAALARVAEADEVLIAAALLHDVGHLLELREGGRADGRVLADLGHEGRGARYLGAILPPPVTGPIALHVAAKRHRCAVEPEYEAALSAGSRRSLARQGGPMSPDEVARYQAHPAHQAASDLRTWDDRGKVEGLEVAPLMAYVPLLEALVNAP